MNVSISRSHDPAANFALERELLEARAGDFLLLYIDSPCVVVGRNQHPEAEADTAYCTREGIPVLRRLTGGGAVYHDEGNLNFAFITPVDKNAPPLDISPLGEVISALHEFGVEATAGGRGELLVGGKKISGTASCVKNGRRLFHGTLLFDSDLTKMSLALSGDTGLRGRKVSSVPSPVANLKPLLAGFDTASAFMDALAALFLRRYTASLP